MTKELGNDLQKPLHVVLVVIIVIVIFVTGFYSDACGLRCEEKRKKKGLGEGFLEMKRPVFGEEEEHKEQEKEKEDEQEDCS